MRRDVLVRNSIALLFQLSSKITLMLEYLGAKMGTSHEHKNIL